jgi:hypothetical protein
MKWAFVSSLISLLAMVSDDTSACSMEVILGTTCFSFHEEKNIVLEEIWFQESDGRIRMRLA